MFYCNSPIKGLADIKGKKVRVQGTSQGDLVEGLGGTGVTIPFAEVVPALQRGTVDCGITGTMPAYKAGWHEVTSHVLALPVGFSVSFSIVSLATWNRLDAKTKAFMEGSFNTATDKWWKTIVDEDADGLNCTTGTGPCSIGKPGKLVKVAPSAEDAKILETAMKDVVLKRWAKRCGTDAACITNWNATVGKVVSLTAAP
jgi:TRAP-type mannitol/chloroaromatic compound transport system substrate-binding protein